MKQGKCEGCGKDVGMVPDDATEITCFRCDNGLCVSCGKRPADPVLLAATGKGHVCGECWSRHRSTLQETPYV